MIIKSADDKQPNITLLEGLRQRSVVSEAQRQAIDKEIRLTRAGMKGEAESAYLIDFDFKASKNTAVIHDLRVEINGRVAQIDHLLIHRTLTVFVLETKHFNSGLKITDEGEFLRWNDFRKTFEGMPSPLAQNERHIDVLKDAFQTIDMPTRMGLRLSPTFESYVLVSQNARIDRSRKSDSSRVIKADLLLKTIDSQKESDGFLNALGSLSRIVSSDTIEDIARRLCALHRPITINYAAKFGIGDLASSIALPPSLSPTPVPRADRVREVVNTEQPGLAVGALQSQASATPTCKACGSGKVAIQYGKYGYYFKCSACDGNSPIKIGCGITGHKEKIRKEGFRFLRECAECKTSSLFFENLPAVP